MDEMVIRDVSPVARADAPPAFATLSREWTSAPPSAGAATTAVPAALEAAEGETGGEAGGETSSFLVRITDGDDVPAAARRASAGLALTLPFALAVGLRTEAPPLEALLGALSLPVGLAVIALVGVSASTLGISLASAPLAPSAAASVASRGLLRAGLLFAGLAPLCALWVASARELEAFFCTSLAVLVAGASGIGTIARGLVAATADEGGSPRLGAVVIALLFAMFALVVGLRVWLPVADALLAPVFGGDL